jgi:hypothetical protein
MTNIEQGIVNDEVLLNSEQNPQVCDATKLIVAKTLTTKRKI